MPTFTDYLLAPWRILSSLGGAGGLCGREKVGDQVLDVCTVGGYSMPDFVLWASVLIIALFLAATLRFFQQSTRIARALARVTRALETAPGGGDAPIEAGEIEAVRKLMLSEPIMAVRWRQFEETFIGAAPGRGGRKLPVYTTSRIDEIFTRDVLIEDHVHAVFYSALPGVLTGIGLLMTFIAILDGLSHVTVTADLNVTGIAGLINGLSGKFVSSIVAITCAVGFVFVERIGYAGPTAAYRRLIDRLSRRFRRKTAEQLLFELQSSLLERGEGSR